MKNNKKNTLDRLPMPGKVKKGFRYYATVVLVVAILCCMAAPVYAADDPLAVVNNLNTFVFGLCSA